VSNDSPSARLRWLYYPDHLVSLPHPSEGILAAVRKLLTEPVLQGLIWDTLTEPLKDGRDDSIEDESIGDFISRRVNKKLVDNVVSAVFHGIYAGDVWQLSAKSLMPAQWSAEKEFDSVLLGIPKLRTTIPEDEHRLILELLAANQPSLGLKMKLRNAGVITLKGGLQQISERLESLLKMGGNVTFKPSTRVERIALQEDGEKIQVSCEYSSSFGQVHATDEFY
jgi:oxygen-dependent protoporphyrinogen oxidase